MASSVKAPPYARYALYALAGVLVLWLLKGRGGLTEGREAPEFDLPLVSAAVGEPTRFSLATREDKPVLIEVFASWCGSCRRAAPLLAKAHQKFGDDVAFVGVSVDDEPELALEAKRDWNIPYAV